LFQLLVGRAIVGDDVNQDESRGQFQTTMWWNLCKFFNKKKSCSFIST